MKELKLQFLYGHEFWDKLEYLITNAKERVFLVSAYIGQKTYSKYVNMIPKNVFNMTICRNDSFYIPTEALQINQDYFHGKIYLIDNVIIIGSQNLYDAGKEGEFSTLIETDEFNSSLILYQALLKLIEKEPVLAEPVNTDFIDFYENGCLFVAMMIFRITCLYILAQGMAEDLFLMKIVLVMAVKELVNIVW